MTPEQIEQRIAALEAQQSQLIGWLQAIFPVLSVEDVGAIFGASLAVLLAAWGVRQAIRALN